MSGTIQYACFRQTWLGEIYIARSPGGVVGVAFGDHEIPFARQIQARLERPVEYDPDALESAMGRLRAYLDGEADGLDLTIDWSVISGFRQKVLKATARIPPGSVATYGEIAAHIGKPKAARAVGQALKRNPMPLVIPCHRVIAADGSMCGYGSGEGIPTKRALLRLEGFLGA
jgi:methylated-DNA-[protein]-cysteine S-methyltransferase